jgi:hypothetical protein
MLKLQTDQKHPMPDWQTEWDLAETLGGDLTKLKDFWDARGREWAVLLRESFGPDYKWYESEHFWLICGQKAEIGQRLLGWTEQVYTRLIAALGEIARPLIWRVPVIVTSTQDEYYSYICPFYPDGEHASTGGIYLNSGYGHFVFCYLDLNSAESVIAHELTHALLDGLPIPLWLNEGIAQLAEISVTGRHYSRTEEILETIDVFWSSQTIQEFWDGSSFGRPDEGQMHSYHLALVLTRKLTGDITKFRRFVLAAQAADAGDSALVSVFGFSLEDLVGDYLGDGQWKPNSPNKSLQPTATAVTLPADAGSAPAVAVAEH